MQTVSVRIGTRRAGLISYDAKCYDTNISMVFQAKKKKKKKRKRKCYRLNLKGFDDYI